MRDGIGKPVFHTAPRARGCDLDPVCELPYRPAATERPQQRPNRCQHLTTRTTVPKILLALTEASTDVKRRSPPVIGQFTVAVRVPAYRTVRILYSKTNTVPGFLPANPFSPALLPPRLL